MNESFKRFLKDYPLLAMTPIKARASALWKMRKLKYYSDEEISELPPHILREKAELELESVMVDIVSMSNAIEALERSIQEEKDPEQRQELYEEKALYEKQLKDAMEQRSRLENILENLA